MRIEDGEMVPVSRAIKARATSKASPAPIVDLLPAGASGAVGEIIDVMLL